MNLQCYIVLCVHRCNAEKIRGVFHLSVDLRGDNIIILDFLGHFPREGKMKDLHEVSELVIKIRNKVFQAEQATSSEVNVCIHRGLAGDQKRYVHVLILRTYE